MADNVEVNGNVVEPVLPAEVWDDDEYDYEDELEEELNNREELLENRLTSAVDKLYTPKSWFEQFVFVDIVAFLALGLLVFVLRSDIKDLKEFRTGQQDRNFNVGVEVSNLYGRLSALESRNADTEIKLQSYDNHFTKTECKAVHGLQIVLGTDGQFHYQDVVSWQCNKSWK